MVQASGDAGSGWQDVKTAGLQDEDSHCQTGPGRWKCSGLACELHRTEGVQGHQKGHSCPRSTGAFHDDRTYSAGATQKSAELWLGTTAWGFTHLQTAVQALQEFPSSLLAFTSQVRSPHRHAVMHVSCQKCSFEALQGFGAVSHCKDATVQNIALLGKGIT